MPNRNSINNWVCNSGKGWSHLPLKPCVAAKPAPIYEIVRCKCIPIGPYAQRTGAGSLACLLAHHIGTTALLSLADNRGSPTMRLHTGAFELGVEMLPHPFFRRRPTARRFEKLSGQAANQIVLCICYHFIGQNDTRAGSAGVIPF